MKYIKSIVLIAFIATGANAESLTYECQVEDQKGYGWIAPNYVFVIDTESSSATNASSHYDFTKTRFKIDRKGRYKLFWKAILTSSTSGQEFEVHYTAHISPTSNSIQMRGTIISHRLRNRPIGKGICKVRS